MKTKFRLFALTIGLIVFFENSSSAQTMSSTVITQPCNNNGQIGVTVTGLTPPISYTCQNALTNQSFVNSGVPTFSTLFTGLPGYQSFLANPNQWFISASDGTNTAFDWLIMNPAFYDSINVVPGNCPAPSTLQAIGFVGGTPPFTFSWTNVGTSQNYTTNPLLVPNGSYTVVITDGAGCVVISAPGGTTNIKVSNVANFTVGIGTGIANCTNGTASITSIGAGATPPYTFLWNNSATSQNISGLVQGLYYCKVTDANGCQVQVMDSVLQAVSINFNTSSTNATCIQTNGSILGFTSGGTPPYSYFWSNGATTQNITGLVPGYYSVQITDANGCTGSGGDYISSTTPVNVTFTASPSSCTLANGSATLFPTGGQAPYTIVWNTFPSITTGLSISGRTSGNYSFKVTDANGCIQTGWADILTTSTLSAFINSTPVICPATSGNLTVVAAGSNPPFSYLWNTAATTSLIASVPLAYYTCTITDAAGCRVSKSQNLSSISPVVIGYNATPSSCIFSANGSVSANATGGTAPYTYVWSNSQSGPVASGLVTGNYYATATDANGCTNNNYNQAFVGYNVANNSCYCTITGTVYSDNNLNCIRNAGENGIANVQIHCVGIGYAYTNANGVYSFLVPTGIYTVTQPAQQNYSLAGCQSNSQVMTANAGPSCLLTANFANTIMPTNDLKIIISNMNAPIPGNNYQQKLIVQNDGTNTQSTIQVRYKHDGQLSYINSAPWALIQQNVGVPTWYSVLSGFPTLTVGASSASFINYNVPTNIPLGTQVICYDTVSRQAPVGTNWLSDLTPWNNVNSSQAIVVASYDPNFKEVSPRGSGPEGIITRNDTLLTYVVHFQNEGTYYAQNVVVVDTLDSNLDIRSLRPGYSDHQYTVTMTENGVLKFDFVNIFLPWRDAFGDLGSSGMFTYTIKVKNNLPVGTRIRNKAAIYFDYNQPVITNRTINTIVKSITSIKEFNYETSTRMVIYPNPATNYFDLRYESSENAKGLISIYDLDGRLVANNSTYLKTGENKISGDVGNLQNGIYLVQLKTENSTHVGKLIISR
ncbi:MAG: T9SS type A sorting domain-containing protein [bacterium]|nr:T9SS type A sorting domain-containing protein [bacterium]